LVITLAATDDFGDDFGVRLLFATLRDAPFTTRLCPGKINARLRPFARISALAKNGDCPFYLSFNRGAEVVIGWLNFPSGQAPAADGSVLWVTTGANSFAATLQASSLR